MFRNRVKFVKFCTGKVLTFAPGGIILRTITFLGLCLQRCGPSDGLMRAMAQGELPPGGKRRIPCRDRGRCAGRRMQTEKCKKTNGGPFVQALMQICFMHEVILRGACL